MATTYPLEGDWIERRLTIVVAGRPVTGTARANWGAVEVTVTSPVAGPSRRLDGRGWAFGLACSLRPEYRFALAGEFTARGLEVAERLLADLFLDWLAVSWHAEEVKRAVRQTGQDLAAIGRDYEPRRQPLHERKDDLRKLFKAGELTQQEYQRRRKELGRELEELDHDRREAEAAVRERFEVWFSGRCGRRVPLDEAERLLAGAAAW